MQLRVSNAKDVYSSRLIAEFDSSDGSDYYAHPSRHVDLVVLNSGVSPSYAFIPMPLRGWGPGQWDEQAPTVALQRGGPAGALKMRTKCRIYTEYNLGSSKYKVPVMNAWVVKHSHQGGEDSVITEVWDAKWILSKYTMTGRLCWDPSTDVVYWDFDKPKVYNALGYPDCLDHPTLGPVFAPCHRFGFRNDFDTGDASSSSTIEDNTEPEPGKARNRARSWRCKDALQDNQRTHSAEGVHPPFPVDIGNMKLPDDIIWKPSIGSLIGDDRPLKGFGVEGMSVLDGIQAILRKAGAYDLYIQPQGNNSIVTVVDMYPKSFSGVLLQTPEYGAAHVGVAVNSATIVKRWKVDESFINGFDNVAIKGDTPRVERMVSTYSVSAGSGADNPGGDSAPGCLYLEPAWSAADELAFKIYIDRYNADGNTGAQAFESACKRWPLVYCAYRIKRGADIWKNTKWAGIKQGGFSALEPFQCTGYQQDSANPRNWTPREIVVEYLQRFDDDYDQDNDPALNGATPNPEDIWHEAGRFDNLTLSADGTMVILSGLRGPPAFANGSYTWVSRITHTPGDPTVGHPKNGKYFGQEMRKRHIRIQLAIRGQHPLVSIAGKGGTKADDPNRIYDRVASNMEFTWLVPSEEGDYVELLRSEDSRPIGEANISEINDGGGKTAFPAKCTEGNELFTDRINNETGRQPNHARARLKDVKRVDISATLEIEALAACHTPGTSMTLEGADTLPVYGVIKTVILRSNPRSDEEGQCTLIIEPPDSSAIYDMPSGGRVAAGYNSGYSDQTRTNKDTEYDTYDGGTGGSSGGSSSSSGSSGNAAPSAPGDESSEVQKEIAADAAKRLTAKKQASDRKAAVEKTGGVSGLRAENARKMAADARAKGDDRAAERHEKNARRLERKGEKEQQRRDSKNMDPTTTVNGGRINLMNGGFGSNFSFGKVLEGGGFTMPGGSKQVRAGMLGQGGEGATTTVDGKRASLTGEGGPGRMFDTSKADEYDHKRYGFLKEQRNAADRASIEKFAAQGGGGRGLDHRGNRLKEGDTADDAFMRSPEARGTGATGRKWKIR